MPDVNRVASTFDVILKRFSQRCGDRDLLRGWACGADALGSIVAGGASVPGVEKAVSACMWGLGLCLLALPRQDVFNSMPFAGVFTGYTGMVAASGGERLVPAHASVRGYSRGCDGRCDGRGFALWFWC